MRINDTLSVCKLRQFYKLGCRDCTYLDNCLKYRNNHGGLKPYEVEKIQRNNNNTSKEKEENGGF